MLQQLSYTQIKGAPVNVKSFGAVGDGVTDDLAAFIAAKNEAASLGKALYIPSTPNYYKLSDVFIIDTQSLNVFGDGTNSCLVSHNSLGADAIKITASHVSIRNIGVSGILGSGNGIHINTTGQVGQARIEGVWIGWMGSDGFRVTRGQSNIFTDCSVDQNSGYRPITLTGGATEGFCNIGFHVLSEAGGNTNNQSFVNCRANAGGLLYNVKIGTELGVPVESCSWVGGLIQGSGQNHEIYLRTKYGSISQAHIEPPAGAYTGYCVTMDGCVDTVITDCVVQGDTTIIGGYLNGFTNVVTMGIAIDSTSLNNTFTNMVYKSNGNGPTGGNIIDQGIGTQFINTINSSNEFFSFGDNLPTKTKFFTTNMQDWVGTTMPCGFIAQGAPTISKESTIKKSFDYSAKVVATVDLHGFRINLLPSNYLEGKRVLVEAWVYNETLPGLGLVGLLLNGSAGYYQSTTQHDVWERVLVSFNIPIGSTGVQIHFVNAVGTVYWDSIAIWVEGDYAHLQELTLDGTATPTVSYGNGVGSYQVPTVRTSGTPTITNFLNPHVGKPFTILFDGATVIQNNANIKLAGAVNFSGTTSDTLTLVYDSNSIFREVSRSVN